MFPLKIIAFFQSRSPSREIQTIQLEIEQLRLGNYRYYMEKEIYEQPESIRNTTRGRVNFERAKVIQSDLRLTKFFGHKKKFVNVRKFHINEVFI